MQRIARGGTDVVMIGDRMMALPQTSDRGDEHARPIRRVSLKCIEVNPSLTQAEPGFLYPNATAPASDVSTWTVTVTSEGQMPASIAFKAREERADQIALFVALVLDAEIPVAYAVEDVEAS